MANLKTKLEKHVNDDKKRRKSIIEKEKIKLNQSLIIKQALSSATLHHNFGKKVVFDEEKDINSGNSKVNKKHSNGNEKSLLFDNSESESEEIAIKEKIQFSGEKGFELLNLQSTYGNDERFKIDERFIDDEKEDVYQCKNKGSSNEKDTEEEKIKQLKILENVLGTPVIKPVQEKKLKKRTYEMIRYDASNKNHEIYEINTKAETFNPLSLSKKRKERNEMHMIDKGEFTKPVVSKEKFYEVSDEIKNCFKEKKGENGQFSLLQIYGVNGVENNLEIEENEMQHNKGEKGEETLEDDFVDEENVENVTNNNNYKFIKGMDNEASYAAKKEEKSVTAKGIWKEPFFFTQDDPRIKEGLEFINKKNSLEASEAAENYDQMRRKLKEILRLHLKKQLCKKNPFKNKIGGMNKKQLVNSKFKTSKMFNKRKSYKKSPVGKI